MTPENPFLNYPDAIESRKKVKAILLDCFPEKRVNTNVLLAAYDSGIVSEIQNSRIIDNTFVMRFVKTLISDYAIQPPMAKWSVLYWIEMYGAQLLKKNISITNNDISDEMSESDINIPVSIDEPIQLSFQFETTVEEMKDGDKIPKSAIDIKNELFKKFGINKFTCVIRKDKSQGCQTSLKITGEYEGTANKDILLIFMCFNIQNELIGTQFRETIGNNFTGASSYSTWMDVPNWETIAKIEVRPIIEPASI